MMIYKFFQRNIGPKTEPMIVSIIIWMWVPGLTVNALTLISPNSKLEDETSTLL